MCLRSKSRRPDRFESSSKCSGSLGSSVRRPCRGRPAPARGTAEQDADDPLALIDRLQLDGPIVIASSFGASVTLKAVARARQAFSALVIHEPPLLGLVASHPVAGSQVAKVISHFHQNIVTLLEAGRMEEGARVFMEPVPGRGIRCRMN